jgi:hypothetical protein
MKKPVRKQIGKTFQTSAVGGLGFGLGMSIIENNFIYNSDGALK